MAFTPKLIVRERYGGGNLVLSAEALRFFTCQICPKLAPSCGWSGDGVAKNIHSDQ